MKRKHFSITVFQHFSILHFSISAFQHFRISAFPYFRILTLSFLPFGYYMKYSNIHRKVLAKLAACGQGGVGLPLLAFPDSRFETPASRLPTTDYQLRGNGIPSPRNPESTPVFKQLLFEIFSRGRRNILDAERTSLCFLLVYIL